MRREKYSLQLSLPFFLQFFLHFPSLPALFR